jgi:DNA-directed RNA polymerase specialized sigma24 family protein
MSPEVVQSLWERYFPRLVAFARDRLQGRLRGADEEDVALSAFHSFCRGAEAGRFPRLADADGLWPLLVKITARKADNQLRGERAQKRGGGKVAAESVLGPGEEGEGPAIEHIVGNEPTPEFAAQFAEECERLLAALRLDSLRQVAVWKMEGYDKEEIAARLGGVTVRTVERKLEAIRKIWLAEGIDVV